MSVTIMRRSDVVTHWSHLYYLENNMKTKEISIEQLGQISVYDEHSTATKLAELWKEKPAVIVFVRHFG